MRLAPDCRQLLPGAQERQSPYPPPQTRGSGCPEPGPEVASLPAPPCALVGQGGRGQGQRGAGGLGDGAESEAGARLAAGGAAEPPSRRGVDGVPGNGPALRTRALRRWAPLGAQPHGPSGRAASTAPPPGPQQVGWLEPFPSPRAPHGLGAQASVSAFAHWGAPVCAHACERVRVCAHACVCLSVCRRAYTGRGACLQALWDPGEKGL